VIDITFADLLFYFLSALVLICALVVVYSRNIVHSAFSLLGTFAGVAGLYGLCTANFLAAVQILVYVGGVLIIILFAIMLTRNIQDVKISNPLRRPVLASMMGIGVASLLILVAVGIPRSLQSGAGAPITVSHIGDALLDRYLILFEILSLLLLAALLGAVMIVRKEIKPETKKGSRV
jgi:NADH:ubiquinone oxidoreductase subunit 6 (subunit J)